MMKRVLIFMVLLGLDSAIAAELQISLPEPEWLLAPVSQPLTQREAGLQPREQGLATRLSPLLTAADYPAALKVIEAEIDPDSLNPYAKFSPGLNFVIGQILLATEQTDRAEAALLAALQQLPDFVRAHQALGLLYLRAERYVKAREHISKAATLGGTNAALFGYLGYVNQQTNNFWGAIGAYQQALMLEHDNRQWQQGLLYALMETRQFGSALALVDELLALNDSEPGLWLYRARIALQMEDDELALTSLELAIRLGDTTLANLQACAQLHLRIGSMPRAIELLKASLVAGVDYNYIDQILAFLIPQEQWAYAGELLAGVRQDWSRLSVQEKSQVLNREASLALADGRQTDALAALQQAIELDPGNAEALLQLAGVYAKDRRYIQAELLYQRASAHDSAKERALLGNAQLAIDQVDYPRALSLLREVSGRNPARVDLRENIRLLENLVTTGQNTRRDAP
ncbi:MAG: tetratricopeptide repeat protein [Pseudomonadales bacterium]|nr:tetratricopeptide repeat protein [Pseudomonadales bacterium]